MTGEKKREAGKTERRRGTGMRTDGQTKRQGQRGEQRDRVQDREANTNGKKDRGYRRIMTVYKTGTTGRRTELKMERLRQTVGNVDGGEE